MPRIRTGYSFRTAAGKLEEVMDRLIEAGYAYAPVTDRASAFAWVRWDKLAKKKGLKPVFGIELAVNIGEGQEKRPTVDYWTFIAKDDLLPLNQLFELATTQFKYEPTLTLEQAQEAFGVWKIVGHRSPVAKIKPADDIFVALSPSSAKGYIGAALRAGHELVASSDNKFPREADAGLYEVIVGRNAAIQTYDQHIQTNEEWMNSVYNSLPNGYDAKWMIKSVENRDMIFEKSKAALTKGALPKIERKQSLLAMCEDGAKRVGCDLADPVYQKRLIRELGMIEQKKFEDYFYIVSDAVQWARKKMIVGPARGSSCGSLTCYLLEITTVDPIPYGLIFERFIDINRNDLPDIDIDFSDQQRHLVFEYMKEKYGAAHVARLGTVSTYGPPAALKEAGAALQVPKWKCDAVVESLLKRSSGDARALDSLSDTFKTMQAGIDLIREHPEMAIAARMEGHPSHSSQHAAGIILTQLPVNCHVAIDRQTGATQCDKKDAEALNLLKIDALGLTQLSVFEYALELAGLKRLHLETVPLDDPEAFKVLNDGKFAGIFQYNGNALQRNCSQFVNTNLDDIVAITALARPGPLASGGTDTWVARRNGAPVTYPHAMFEPYLRDTFGVVVYQEQVMEIGRNVGDLSWEDVSELRKAMSKSLGKEFFDKFGNPWKAAAIAKGGDPKVMEKVWDDLCSYGSWSFNKSHAVCYGIISYWCLWLKAHYPFEFAAATLTHEPDPSKQLKLLREMVDEGYHYLAVDKDRSTDRWTVGHDKDGKRILIGPFTSVKGIGPKTIKTILSARARGEVLPSKVLKLLSGGKTEIDSLFPIADAVKRLLPDPAARNIFTPATPIKLIEIKNEEQNVLIYCVFRKIQPRDENELVNIAKRGGKVIKGEPTASLNLFVEDDTDSIFCKISRWDYAKMGKAIVDAGQPGKRLYAVKGVVVAGGTFRMIRVKAVRYIGDLVEIKTKQAKKPKTQSA